MSHKRHATIIALAAALVAPLLALATPAQADVTGTWTNTGALSGADCPVTWSGDSSYSVAPTSIIKITQAAGQAGCSLTITSTDLSTWQISTNSGASWTTLFGPYEGLPASGGSFPRDVWFRVGTTAATIGSGDYTSNYGADFQIPVISIFPTRVSGSAELTFRLPDGRECGTISPVSVAIDSVYTLPAPGADCRTTDGAEILGWKVGWDDLVHPPGHTILIVDSQQFTAVLKEEVLTVEFDANVAAEHECFAGRMYVPLQNRTITQEVDREDLTNYRIMVDPICTPPRHYFAGWSTTPAVASDADLIPIGAKAPTSWATTADNNARLYAQWKPSPIRVIDIENPSAIQALTPVHVLIGTATPAPGAVKDGVVTLTSYTASDSFTNMSDTMSQSIVDFFFAGGQSLTIVPTPNAFPESLVSAIAGIEVAGALDIAAPEMQNLDEQSWLDVASALVTRAADVRAMAWLDPPTSVTSNSPDQAVSGLEALAGQLRQRAGAAAESAVLMSSGVVEDSWQVGPASGAILGVRASVDEGSGVWYGIGGVNVPNVVGPELTTTASQRALLAFSGVSPIVKFGDLSTHITPTVTLNSAVHSTTKRMQDWLEQSVDAGLEQFSSYPDNATTWALMESDLLRFFGDLYQQGALGGSSQADAATAKCSATTAQVTKGIVICNITVQLTYPSEPFAFTVQQQVRPGVPSAIEDAVEAATGQ